MKDTVDFRTDKFRSQLKALLEEADKSFEIKWGGKLPVVHPDDLRARDFYVLGYVRAAL